MARRPQSRRQGGALGWSRERSRCRAERGLGTAPKPKALGRVRQGSRVCISHGIAGRYAELSGAPSSYPSRPVSPKMSLQIQIRSPPPLPPPPIPPIPDFM